MTPLALWAAVAVVALLATASWALVARQTAVYVTSGLSFTSWSWLALTGGDVAMITRTGATVWIRQSTASIQFVALALAIISLVVFSLRLLGAFPSPTENAAEATAE
jgi:hypothetical protein